MVRPMQFLDAAPAWIAVVGLACVVAVQGQGIAFPGSPISEEKDSCNLPSGAKGTCKNIIDCPVAALNLDSQPPKICGFNGKIPIVCCPKETMDVTESTTTITNFFTCPSNGLHADPMDCNSYYSCWSGTPTHVMCREGTMYSPTTKNCDWAANVECSFSTTKKPSTQSPSTVHQKVKEVTTQEPFSVKPTTTKSTTPAQKDSMQLTDISPPLINFDCGYSYLDIPDELLELSEEPSVPVDYASHCLTAVPSLGGIGVEDYKYPWMALLGQDKAGERKWFCGGVVINRRWVLTAAHCTNRYNATVVRLGEHDYTKDDDGVHEDVNVAEVVFHNGYKIPEAYHDLSLIRLATPIKIRKEVSPVCLPWGDEANLPLEGHDVIVSGWGTTRYFGDALSPFLNEINVTVLPIDVCASSYSSLLDFTYNYPQSLGQETLCIGDISNQTIVKDSCPGDSGGPAVIERDYQYTVVGIVSKGFGCGKKKFPGLYVRVQHPEHLAWIKRVAFSTCDSLCYNGNCNPSIGCVCLDGWSGEFCDIPICDPPCQQGYCAKPNYCECECPWFGDRCQNIYCYNGNSFDGFTCTCDVGFTGQFCDTEFCNPSCVKGYCKDQQCQCYYGHKGEACEQNFQCHEHDTHFYMGNQCFFVITTTWTRWSSALDDCKDYGGTLAEPNNLTKFQMAVEYNSTYSGSGFWLGGVYFPEENVWNWISDGTKIGNSETWYPEEPVNNYDEWGDCIFLRVDDNHITTFEGHLCEDSHHNYACQLGG